MENHLLLDILYYLAATVIFVPLFKSLGLSSVLGYLVAGMALGPAGTGLLKQSDHITEISQTGIILLLFAIGMELTPARLQKLKGVIFKDGLIQFSATSSVFFALLMFFNVGLTSSIILAMGLSLSSTAFALYYLKESDQLTKSYGQSSFGILLFQDIIIIPLLTIIPFFGANIDQGQSLHLMGFVKSMVILIGVLGTA